jgi:hypothetical protein
MPDKFQGWPKEFKEFEEFERLGSWQEQILCRWSRRGAPALLDRASGGV